MIAEGLIKLPSGLYAELERFVLNWYFAHVYATIERRFRFDEDTLDSAHRLVNAACMHHGVKPSATDIRTARDKLSFTKVFTLDENVYGEEIYMKVTLKLMLERAKTKNLGKYNNETGFITLSAFNLHMTGPSLGTLSAIRHSLGKVDELLGYLKHELTHLVQYRALAGKNVKQVAAGYDDVESEANDEYMLSQVEFDPLIKSAKGMLARLAVKYKTMPGFSKRELQDAFLCVADPPEWMLPEDRSGFFETLKRRAPVKWRKAVKLFMADHKY